MSRPTTPGGIITPSLLLPLLMLILLWSATDTSMLLLLPRSGGGGGCTTITPVHAQGTVFHLTEPHTNPPSQESYINNSLADLTDIVVDAPKNQARPLTLYVADQATHRVYKLDQNVTAIAGSPEEVQQNSPTINTTAPLTAVIPFPKTLALTDDGTTLFIGHRRGIARLDLALNEFSIVAGNQTDIGFRDGPSRNALFHYVRGMALNDAQTGIFVTDALNHVLRFVDLTLNSVTTLAGTPTQPGPVSGTGTLCASAHFNTPRGIAIMKDSTHIYVVDGVSKTIVDINLIPTCLFVAIFGEPFSSTSVDGLPGMGTFSRPGGLALDAAGNLIVSDGPALRKVSVNTREIGTLAGLLNTVGNLDGDAIANARLNVTRGIAVVKGRGANDVYFTDQSRVKFVESTRFTASSSPDAGVNMEVVSDVACFGTLDAPTSVLFGAGQTINASSNITLIKLAGMIRDQVINSKFCGFQTTGVDISEDPYNGVVYITCRSAILYADITSRGALGLLTGKETQEGYNDLDLKDSLFGVQLSTAVDFSEETTNSSNSGQVLIYVADRDNHCIRMINVRDDQVSTLAGANVVGYEDATNLLDARFDGPNNIAFDSVARKLYVTGLNNAIRVIDLKPGSTGVTTLYAHVQSTTSRDTVRYGPVVGTFGKISLDRFGRLFFSTTDVPGTWKVYANGVVTNVVGTFPYAPGQSDGPIAATRVAGLKGSCFDWEGRAAVASPSTNSIRLFSAPVSPPMCTPGVCRNGGQCIDGLYTFTCQCLQGFAGDHCEKRSACHPLNPCLNFGECEDAISAPFFDCWCQDGFIGQFCQDNILCDSNPCENGGTCIGIFDGGPAFSCACGPAFTGPTCTTSVAGTSGDESSSGSITVIALLIVGCTVGIGVYFRHRAATQGSVVDKTKGILLEDLEGGSVASKEVSRSSKKYAIFSNTSKALSTEFLASFGSRSSIAELDEYFVALQNAPSRRVWKEALAKYMSPLVLFSKEKFKHFCVGLNVQNWILPLLLRKDVSAAGGDGRSLLDSMTSISMSGEQSLIQLAMLLVNEVHYRQLTGGGDRIPSDGPGITGLVETLRYFRESNEWRASETSVSVCRLLLFTLVNKLQSSWNPPSSPQEGRPLSLAVSRSGFEDASLVSQIVTLLKHLLKKLRVLNIDPPPESAGNLIMYLDGDLSFWSALAVYMRTQWESVVHREEVRSRASASSTPVSSADELKMKNTTQSSESARAALLYAFSTRQWMDAPSILLKQGVVQVPAACKSNTDVYAGSMPAVMLEHAEEALRKRHGDARLAHVASFAKKVMSSPSPEKSASRSNFSSSSINAANAYDLEIAEVDLLREFVQSKYCIGQGAFGKVFKARFRGDDVALKVVRMRDDRSLQKFLEEVQSQAVIRSPRLLSVMGYSCQPPDLFLVTELMKRGSLADVLNKSKNEQLSLSGGAKSLTIHMKLDICVQTCKALAYLHGMSPPLLHGDVKVHNVLIGALSSEFISVKVGDFGLSRGVKAQAAETSHMKGSMLYMAPEAFGGSEAASSVEEKLKMDVYSFGILLLECFGGTVPWMDMDAVSLISAHSNRVERRLEADTAAQVPCNVLDLAYRCMSHEPKDRPTMTEALSLLEAVEV